jgi:hypothetical protein
LNGTPELSRDDPKTACLNDLSRHVPGTGAVRLESGMSKTLSGIYAHGFTLAGASWGVLNPVSVSSSIAIGSGLAAAALYAQGPDAWTVTSQGTIAGGAVAGIELGAGGVVVNNARGI